jgi:hypothetical protein
VTSMTYDISLNLALDQEVVDRRKHMTVENT